MKSELLINPEDQVILDAIKNTGKSWHEIILPKHPMYPQFIRKLVVTGFNTPDMERDEDRIYVYVRQYLVLEENSSIYKRLVMPLWMIHEGNVEEIMGQNGVLKGIRRTTNDQGEIIEEKPEVLKTQSVQYVRFMVKTKAAHLVDILERFMGQYITLFDKEINDI